MPIYDVADLWRQRAQSSSKPSAEKTLADDRGAESADGKRQAAEAGGKMGIVGVQQTRLSASEADMLMQVFQTTGWHSKSHLWTG